MQYKTVRCNTIRKDPRFTMTVILSSHPIPSHRSVFIDRTAWSAPSPTIQTSSCRTAYLRARACSSLPLRMLYEAYSCTYARYRHHFLHIAVLISHQPPVLYSTLLYFSRSSLLSLTLFMNHSLPSSLLPCRSLRSESTKSRSPRACP
jgi:hypothetical protein